MAVSKIEICNLALASLGADSIRAFDEDNKRARMCDTFYNFTVAYLLSKFDWPFARKFVKINQVITDDIVPDGLYVYQLPSDCKTPRDLYPKGSKDSWEIMGNKLYCAIHPDQGVYLYYTGSSTDVAMFTDTFADLVATGVAVRLAVPITSDVKIADMLYQKFRISRQEAWESDANIGEEYKNPDDTAEYDTFVAPNG